MIKQLFCIVIFNLSMVKSKEFGGKKWTRIECQGKSVENVKKTI